MREGVRVSGVCRGGMLFWGVRPVMWEVRRGAQVAGDGGGSVGGVGVDRRDVPDPAQAAPELPLELNTPDGFQAVNVHLSDTLHILSYRMHEQELLAGKQNP